MEARFARWRFGIEAIRTAAQIYIRNFCAELPASVRRQSLVLGIIAVYWLSGMIVGHIAGMPPAATISTYLPTYMMMMPFMVLCLLGARAIIIMVAERPDRPLTQIWGELRISLATPERLAHAAPMLVAMLAFGGTFTVIKASIPSLAPFTWDQPFEALDRWLHGGVAPWELLQPLLGRPLITHAINWAYNFWFYFLSLIWVWQAFQSRDNRLRLRFFLALILGWILLGNVAATLFSSAGPCYFGRITGLADPYAPLMAYLHGVDKVHTIWALGAQEMLWNNYSLRDVTLGSGISAMPSMHVAIATLFALVCWHTKRWLGVVMTIYAVIIMLGSVHLGWHYAIDGYAGAAGMLVIWWAVGRLVDRIGDPRPLSVARIA
ncbi:MAG TPA: phosphatase PAP2 family protein [Dongiaceae bacterium]|nr:phosphatase PAP2 family protein [Dongiaceae bacterium]